MDGESHIGKYIYCIIRTDQEREFEAEAIGDPDSKVHTICHRDLGCVVSNSPIKEHQITRENTLAHQQVMEKLLEEYTVLPVQFDTIAEPKGGRSPAEQIKEKVLRKRYGELSERIDYLTEKEELGVKALWTDMDPLYAEIARKNPTIKRLQGRRVSRDRAIEIGEQVKDGLEEKREKEEERILAPLRKVACDLCINEKFGEKMVTNSSFLVETNRRGEFDNQVEELMNVYDGRMRFEYIGPVPPSDFVEIAIRWE